MGETTVHVGLLTSHTQARTHCTRTTTHTGRPSTNTSFSRTHALTQHTHLRGGARYFHHSPGFLLAPAPAEKTRTPVSTNTRLGLPSSHTLHPLVHASLTSSPPCYTPTHPPQSPRSAPPTCSVHQAAPSCVTSYLRRRHPTRHTPPNYCPPTPTPHQSHPFSPTPHSGDPPHPHLPQHTPSSPTTHAHPPPLTSTSSYSSTGLLRPR